MSELISNNSNYLDLAIPNGLEDTVFLIQITPQLTMLIKVGEQLICTNMVFKSTSSNAKEFDWENSMANLVSAMRDAKIKDSIINRIHVEFIENYPLVIKYVSALIEIANLKSDNITTNDSISQNHLINNDIYDIYDTPGIQTVSETIKCNFGRVRCKGSIISLSEPYKLITSYDGSCHCGTITKYQTFEIPLFEEPKPKFSACNQCESSVKVTYRYVNAISIELQDDERFNDIERINCILIDTDTKKIRVGERVIVEGDIHITARSSRSRNNLVPILFSKDKVEYSEHNKIVISEQDIEAIKRFAQIKGESVISDLVGMFDKSIIGLNLAKECLLLSIVSASDESNDSYGSRSRLHTLLAGNPGLAKTSLLKKAVKLIENSTHESCQHASGKSLTAIIDKENEHRSLRLGPVPLAKGSVCALNEIGTMHFEDQGCLLDVMEEGEFTINKYGINAKIRSPTTIIASTNIINSNRSVMENDGPLSQGQMPLTKPIVDRFDFVLVLLENNTKEAITEYVEKKTSLIAQKVPNYDLFLQKYLTYARSINPTLDSDGMNLVKDYYVDLKTSNPNFGSNRILETIIRITRGIARLKLKDRVDILDVKEALQLYNAVIYKFMASIVPIPQDPMLCAVEKCSKILGETAGSAWPLEELLMEVCSKDNYIKGYLLGPNITHIDTKKLGMDRNRKIRQLKDLLLRDRTIHITNRKPLMLLKESRESKPIETSVSYVSYVS